MPDETPTDPWRAVRELPIGSRIELRTGDGRRYVGAVVPNHVSRTERILQLKLDNGYNVGVRVGPDATFERLADLPRAPVGATLPSASASLAGPGPWVTVLTTGGTIASRVDYETGGVRPVKEEAEILAFYPELGRTGPVRIEPVFDRLSEDLRPEDWVTLAERSVDAFRTGARGVVIAHGTDTLGYTAAALAFLLADLPGPVVLVGAQRSPDRPSSDGPSNLHAAVEVARTADLGEVVVVMHAGLSDSEFAIHRGPWVRKMHSSRRDAFQSRNGPPIGSVRDGAVSLTAGARPRSPGPARLDGPIDPRASVLWFYPGLAPAQAEAFVRGARGLVLAGTGLGHVAATHLPWIRTAIAGGTVIAMTTQCLEGRVDPYVYATGRELERAGVLYLDDLLPETAYAKMLWALGHADDPSRVAELMRTDRAGEFLPRRTNRGPR
ncbi:glutamyl-tRNA(Gln) amidotransferase subunit D [mine drainage metagenome]|uniref:Glutamyl-tRNA(Gln) amidotransferase subunit D n=1 Tax=mine drainage metagenome TaxID=410659 RepID=T0ZEG0_9ZZZZ